MRFCHRCPFHNVEQRHACSRTQRTPVETECDTEARLKSDGVEPAIFLRQSQDAVQSGGNESVTLTSFFKFLFLKCFFVCSIVQIYNKHAQTCSCLWPQSLFADIRVDSRSVAQMEMVPSEVNQFVPTEVRGKKDR